MGKRNYSKSFEIALSAISCATAVIALMLGFWSGVLLGTGYFLGVIALMVPLSKEFYLGDFLAYAGTVILTIILGAAARFWDLVPFIMFFGLHPLVNALQLKFKINRWIALAVKAIWFDFTLWVGYILIFHGVVGGDYSDNAFFAFLNDYILLFIFVGGSLIFFIYDYITFTIQGGVNRLVYRIRK